MMGIVAVDLEGTLTNGETWRAIGRYLTQNGRKREYHQFLFDHIPGMLLTRAGIINMYTYRLEWLRGLARAMAGFSPEQVADLAEWVVENEVWAKHRPDVLEDVLQYQAEGHRVVLVTGAFQPIAETFAIRAGLDDVIATPLGVKNGFLTGLVGTFNIGERKVENLRDYLRGDDLIAAYGDTAPDVAMLELSQHPVAVYPQDDLRQVAVARDWRILES